MSGRLTRPLASDRRRPLRVLALLALAVGAFAAAPSGASAAAPTPNTCSEDSPGSGEYTCMTQAITINGYQVLQSAFASIPRPPVGGHITHMETDVVDINGNPIPIQRLMLHHIVFFNQNRSDAVCGGPERFYAAGEERAKMGLPDGYGLPNSGNWSQLWMLMNHKAEVDTAYVQYKVTVEQGAYTPVKPYWLDVEHCAGDPIYNLPGTGAEGSTLNHSGDFTVKSDGWIVSGGGHVHGGARELSITEPGCGNREIAKSTPTWGLREHPFYNVRPILHEPGPINMSGFSTVKGIPVKQGQTLRLNSIYDNSRPHTRVMGIFVVYIAPDTATDPSGPTGPTMCGAMPDDLQTFKTNEPGRTDPPFFTVPLTGIDPNTGEAVTIDGPPGKFQSLSDGATIQVGDRFFSQPNVLIKPGSTLNWHFQASENHNVTLADGPLGIGSPNMSNGTFSQRFDQAGTYRLFCALHPVQMTERVIVKADDPKPTKHKKKKKKKRKKR